MVKMLKLKAPKFKKIDDDVLPSLDIEEGRTILGKSHKQVHRKNDKGCKLEKSRKDRKRRVDRFLDKAYVLRFLSQANIVCTPPVPIRGQQYEALLTKFLPFPLHEYLDDMSGDEPQCCVNQLTNALCYLHRRHIVHGDLKQVKVVTDRSNVFKLCGLGSTQVLPWESEEPKRWTSPRREYRAPELDDLSLELNAFKMGNHSFGVLSC
ncbi:probable cell division protein kinase ECU08_0230 [Aplysia californica]|uniref:Probable cell division protein kinase ECU08_0230 n=1 Tax=Aplysia californica TaxID=6500 RepID=A0ABM0JX12_APLCA|nr:probable cell division protein kinase ECU08_0230 [Aplysia californica]